MPFLGFGSCHFGICLMPFLGFGIHEITEIEIVQDPVRKLKAETIDMALQQIREACGVLESDSNIEQFLVFKQHILAGTSIYKNCLMEKAKKKKQQKLLDFYVFNC